MSRYIMMVLCLLLLSANRPEAGVREILYGEYPNTAHTLLLDEKGAWVRLKLLGNYKEDFKHFLKLFQTLPQTPEVKDHLLRRSVDLLIDLSKKEDATRSEMPWELGLGVSHSLRSFALGLSLLDEFPEITENMMAVYGLTGRHAKKQAQALLLYALLMQRAISQFPLQNDHFKDMLFVTKEGQHYGDVVVKSAQNATNLTQTTSVEHDPILFFVRMASSLDIGTVRLPTVYRPQWAMFMLYELSKNKELSLLTKERGNPDYQKAQKERMFTVIAHQYLAKLDDERLNEESLEVAQFMSGFETLPPTSNWLLMAHKDDFERIFGHWILNSAFVVRTETKTPLLVVDFRDTKLVASSVSALLEISQLAQCFSSMSMGGVLMSDAIDVQVDRNELAAGKGSLKLSYFHPQTTKDQKLTDSLLRAYANPYRLMAK